MPPHVVQGVFVILLGAVALLTAPTVARWNRQILQRAAGYETGYRWTSRIAGLLLIAVGMARMLGWDWPLRA